MKRYQTNKLRNAAILLSLAAAMAACKGKQGGDVPTAKAIKGVFQIDLFEEGEVEAVKAINISAPMISWRYGGNLKITYIIKDGTEVKKGDTVMVFDPTDVNKAIIDAESRMEISMAELEKIKAQQQSSMEEMKADYEVTRLSYEISKIRSEQAAYESEIKKKEIVLNLQKAEIALAKAKEEIDNKELVNAEEMKQKELSIAQDRTRLNEAQDALRMLTVISPAPGIAILERNWSSGNKYQTGDQVWSGNPVIALPDLSKLKATVNINEVDIAKITKGLRVEVKPDAFSESAFHGEVSAVANLAVNKEGSTKIKVFPVQVLLKETHKNLLPGLTVSCRIIIDQIDDVLYIPAEAVHAEGDKFYVFKKERGKFDKTYVETGLSNSNFTIIASGLDKGDAVALVDPFVLPAAEEGKAATGKADARTESNDDEDQ